MFQTPPSSMVTYQFVYSQVSSVMIYIEVTAHSHVQWILKNNQIAFFAIVNCYNKGNIIVFRSLSYFYNQHHEP